MLFRASKSFLLHQDFGSIFPQSEQLQDLAYEYLTVTVVVSTKIIHFARMSGWSQIASSFTSSFDTNFNPLENQLKEVGVRIQLCTNALAMKASQQSHALTHRLMSSLQMSVSQESRLKALEASKHGLLTALCPNQGEFDAIYRQHRRKANSIWLFSQSRYKHWASSPLQVSRLLWIQGKLGSGKSITMASTVADLTLNEGKAAIPTRELPALLKLVRKPVSDTITTGSSSPVASSICFFFCTSSSPTTLKASTVIGSITYQALCSVSVSEYLHDYIKCQPSNRMLQVGLDPGACIDLLLDLLPRTWMGSIVIDGLDECRSIDIAIIFKALQRLSKLRAIRVLGSCRTLWKDFDRATTLFNSPSATIMIDDVDRSKEVDAYISGKIRTWRSAFSLSSESEDLVRKQLQFGWQGMFLWLALQCDVISEDLSEGIPIGDIISSLPRDLPEAYHRVLLRIKDKEFASRIFRLVTAADPPLSIDELRVAANITPGEAAWNPIHTTMGELAFLRIHGGPLLEMDENRKVYFIHHSVMVHLIDGPVDYRVETLRFDLWDAETHLGSVLLTYLNLSDFNRSIATQHRSSSMSPARVPDEIMQSVASRFQAQKVLQHFRPRSQPQAVPLIDITYLLSRLQQTKSEASQINNELLLNYAKANWFKATKRLDHLDDKIRSTLEALMQGKSGLIPMSFIPPEPTSWAISHEHMCLLQYVLSRHRHDMKTTIRVLTALDYQELARVQTSRLIPLAIQLLEETSIGGELMNILASMFDSDSYEEFDGYVSSTKTLLRSIAPLMLQVLIMYTRSDIVACPMLQAVTQWVSLHSPLYMDQNATDLALRFNKSHEFLSSLSQKASAVHDIFERETIVEHSTPLIRAFTASNMECVNFLLDYGADIEQADANGMTILMHAVSVNNTDVLSKLLLMRVGIEARDQQGWTALHHASGCPDALGDLLQSGAVESIMDAQSRDGLTALHWACSVKCEASVTYLIDAGARIDLKNNEGENVLDLLAWHLQIGLRRHDEMNGDSEKIRRMIRVISERKGTE